LIFDAGAVISVADDSTGALLVICATADVVVVDLWNVVLILRRRSSSFVLLLVSSTSLWTIATGLFVVLEVSGSCAETTAAGLDVTTTIGELAIVGVLITIGVDVRARGDCELTACGVVDATTAAACEVACGTEAADEVATTTGAGTTTAGAADVEVAATGAAAAGLLDFDTEAICELAATLRGIAVHRLPLMDVIEKDMMNR
jgi:hypothetical protein